MVAVRLFRFALLFLLLLLSGRFGAIPSRLRMLPSHLWTMRSHFGLARLLSHLMVPARRPLVLFGFASLDISPVVLIFDPEFVAVLLSIPGLFAVMFSYVPGLVFSRCSPTSLCALAVLLALVE